MASVKTEASTLVKSEASVKPDPAGLEADSMDAIPGVMSDDDVYEDAGDLEFVDLNPATNPAGADILLTHVPKYLHSAWANMDDDEEIRIGTVRKWVEVGKDGRRVEKMALLLDHARPGHQAIPKEYELMSKDDDLANTFLFTEQDLPGYKKSHGANSDVPAYLRRRHEQQQQQQQQQQQRSEDKAPPENGVKKNKYQPRYKKAIPKKTTLAGKFRREINCLPVWTEETKHLLKTMSDDAMKPKVATSIINSFDPSGVIQAGAHVSNDRFSNMVRTAPELSKNKKKQKEEKSARLPQSELRDRIFECYDKYAYWSLKAFKQTLNQPEAWLRENLEELARLHKTGRFANYWELKPEYKRLNVQSVEGAPPSPEPNDSDFDGDDDNIEMEDVKMDGE